MTKYIPKSPHKIICGCGCGRSKWTTQPHAKYINEQHKNRAAKRRFDAKEKMNGSYS